MDPLAGPLLCDPSRKAELEARNGDDQLDYITDLVDRGARELRESHVLTLQEIAIREIYPCGGRYRDATKGVFIQNSKHKLPDVAFVPSLVRDAVDWINRETGSKGPPTPCGVSTGSTRSPAATGGPLEPSRISSCACRRGGCFPACPRCRL